MTITEAKATIYANVVYACEKAGFPLETTQLVQEACDTIIALADRKTEPQYSEDDMYWLSLAEDVANGKMSDAGANQAWFEYINRKTENCSEFPNNCETCKHNKLEWYSEECDGCSQAHSNYEPQTSRENTRDSRDNHEIAKDEPQTHDLHTNTHECVSDAPQTDCPWK